MLNLTQKDSTSARRSMCPASLLAHLFFKDIKTSWTLWDIMHMVDPLAETPWSVVLVVSSPV